MKGTEDVTSQLQESNFEWKKVLQNGNYDKEWNPQYVEGSNHSKIMITQNDVEVKATFICNIVVS